MGRYVYGDFQYKFAFGEQSSNLGEVLEEISSELDYDAIYTKRYIDKDYSGEICQVTINDSTQFIEHVEEKYLKDFKDKTDEEWKKWSRGEKFGEYWHTQNMLKLFIENIKENELDYLSLEIEY